MNAISLEYMHGAYRRYVRMIRRAECQTALYYAVNVARGYLEALSDTCSIPSKDWTRLSRAIDRAQARMERRIVNRICTGSPWGKAA